MTANENPLLVALDDGTILGEYVETTAFAQYRYLRADINGNLITNLVSTALARLVERER